MTIVALLVSLLCHNAVGPLGDFFFAVHAACFVIIAVSSYYSILPCFSDSPSSPFGPRLL